MTEPLVPPEIDLRSFDYMPLKVAQLRDSDLAAIASDAEFRAAVMLWCATWHQIPASSLPADDRMLCSLAGYGRDLKAWGRVREVALKGFVMCSDGRLYHPLIADLAVRAWQQKKRNDERTRHATEARRQRNDERNDERTRHATEARRQRNDERNDERGGNVTSTKGEGDRKGEGEDVGLGSARTRGLGFETSLREAAGWQNEPHPNLAVTGQIEALIAAGADMDLDVLPTVRALAPRANSRTSWKYFVKAIAQARDDRIAASKIVSTIRNSTPTKGPIKNGYVMRDSVEQACDYIDRREQESGENGGQDDTRLLPGLRQGPA